MNRGLIMNIPDKVRIGSCDYAVEFTDQTLVAKGRESYAVIDYDNHKIRINKTIGDAQNRELSFLHELFHGIAKERNLQLDNEELVVEEFARGMHQVIRDNLDMFLLEKNEDISKLKAEISLNSVNIEEFTNESLRKVSDKIKEEIERSCKSY